MNLRSDLCWFAPSMELKAMSKSSTSSERHLLRTENRQYMSPMCLLTEGSNLRAPLSKNQAGHFQRAGVAILANGELLMKGRNPVAIARRASAWATSPSALHFRFAFLHIISKETQIISFPVWPRCVLVHLKTKHVNELNLDPADTVAGRSLWVLRVQNVSICYATPKM